MNPYLKQKAAPWVSMAVLAGGLLSACILLFTYKIQSDFLTATVNYDEQYLGSSK